jgi:hypothetical protein
MLGAKQENENIFTRRELMVVVANTLKTLLFFKYITIGS